MNNNINDIKKLREETGAGVLEVKEALEKFSGDYNAAKSELMKKVSSKAEKKAGRTASDGLVASYIHHSGKVGSLVLVACETDFVAKTDYFDHICKDIAMQVCSEDYKDVDELVKSEYIKDPSKTIGDLIQELTAKMGEKIEVKKFVKYSIQD